MSASPPGGVSDAVPPGPPTDAPQPPGSLMAVALAGGAAGIVAAVALLGPSTMFADVADAASAKVTLALSAGGGLALSALLAKFVGAGLYTRIPGDAVLENPKRAAIHHLVSDEPGLTLQDIRRRLRFGWGTTTYHVRRLNEAGLVVSERTNGHRVYPVGHLAAPARTDHALLQGDTTGEAARYVATHDGCSQTDLCRGLGVTKSVASKHLAKLMDAGLVEVERDGRFKRYRATAELRRLLAAGSAPEGEDAHADLARGAVHHGS